MIIIAPTSETHSHIIAYHQNYVMPVYYTESPDEQAYLDNTPENQHISRLDTKYQISVEVPIITFGGGDADGKDVEKKSGKEYATVYIAYTQLSYWQNWNHGSWFFRENDYEPALMVGTPVGQLRNKWQWNAGYVHQSNGRGGSSERTWNRFFIEGGVNIKNLSLTMRLWDVLRDEQFKLHNPDLVHYLGYGEWVASYHLNNNTFSLKSRNNVTSEFSRGFWQASWSFPLSQNVVGMRGFVQYVYGYGQSLIEYDHRSNAVGIGVSFSDF